MFTSLLEDVEQYTLRSVSNCTEQKIATSLVMMPDKINNYDNIIIIIIIIRYYKINLNLY